MAKHIEGPWRWQGEDYRGGWGWQLLVGPNGEGIICGSAGDAPYPRLRAYMPIDPDLCKTGMLADANSAPAVHVLESCAPLILAAPDLLAALKATTALLRKLDVHDESGELQQAEEAIRKAEGS